MSLDIRIDGVSAELATGSSTQLALVNPHFDYSKIAGSTASLPTFPLTRKNGQLFGYWEQPQTGGILARRRLEHYSNGHLIKEATFVLTEAGPLGYTGAMVELLGEFFGDYQNQPLNELGFGSLPMPGVATPGVLNPAGIVVDGQPAIVFPQIVNPDYYGTGGASIGYTNRMNPFSGGSYQTTGPLVPMVMLTYLFKQLALGTGTTIDGSFITHPAYRNLLLYNTRSLDGATSVVTSQHLPGLTVAELFIELRKLFNLKLSFDLVNKRLSIDFWGEVIGKPAGLDWTDKAVGRPLKTPEPNTRLQLGYELDGGDALMKDKPALLDDYLTPAQSTGIPGGIAPLKSRFSTLLMDDGVGTAKAAQAGITAQFAQLNQSFSPRLLFWNGAAGGVPAASNSLQNFGLFWNGPTSLYQNHWLELEVMRAAQFYTKQSFNLSETDLAQLRWETKVHVAGVDYFVLSAEVILPIQKPADLLLVAA